MQIKTTDALIVVDMQNDFLPGGPLPVRGGDEIVSIINALSPHFRHWAFTRDWHPANHCSFSATPEFVDGSWPVHCVQDTPGAAFHQALVIPPGALIMGKATDPARECYSDFEGTTLALDLHRKGVQRLFVCGIATDYCVKATALDGLKHGFEVFLIEDACRAVDNPPGTGLDAIQAMRDAGVIAIDAKEVE